ncbi:COX15/CtaA family protein [bacterium]|nr:COX15/CtaA family protein [bacterium]
MKSLPILIKVTIALTILLIGWGGLTTNTFSGMGCGDDWPLCHGGLFPDWTERDQVVEWTHRALALLVGGFLSVIVALSARIKGLRRPVLASLVLLLLQAGLGMATVRLETASIVINAIHLGIAILFLCSLVILHEYVTSKNGKSGGETIVKLTRWVAIIFFVQIILGALALHAKFPHEGWVGAATPLRHTHATLGVVVLVMAMILSARARRTGTRGLVAPAYLLSSLSGIQMFLGFGLLGMVPLSYLHALVAHIMAAASLIALVVLLMQRIPKGCPLAKVCIGRCPTDKNGA